MEGPGMRRSTLEETMEEKVRGIVREFIKMRGTPVPRGRKGKPQKE
jgi:hypothetical protein